MYDTEIAGNGHLYLENEILVHNQEEIRPSSDGDTEEKQLLSAIAFLKVIFSNLSGRLLDLLAAGPHSARVYINAISSKWE
jgi:hypothetical protein